MLRLGGVQALFESNAARKMGGFFLMRIMNRALYLRVKESEML